ncbi:hypothetical protein Q9R08_00795 [Microbacterium sp. QXD-8]|uniref:Amidase domain-containing protein n=1 Tax=Microbacterium psychrotolerans TaxID=3068321 RepID=A0ABU0YVZ4_9MICO|nr:hypothetical protein [Microbacterium sp. QXD-8]MDQ7876503.1 hypothetical protein [Microbacterium sp. QXD-8]
MLANTGPFNVTGHPALTIPVHSPGMLPIGAMLVGRHHADEDLLAFAEWDEAHREPYPPSPSTGDV